MAEQDGLPGVGDPQQCIVSQRDFAKLVGVSSPAITKAISSGRLSAECVAHTKAGKQLYLGAALAEWREAHPDTVVDQYFVAEGIAGTLSIEGVADSKDLDKIAWAKLKTKREAFVAGERANLLHLERCELEGKLHRAEDVEAIWAEAVLNCRAKLLALPVELAGKISVGVKKDRIAVQTIIEEEIEQALLELSGNVAERVTEQRKKRVARGKKRGG